MDIANKLINWLSMGEFDSLRYKVEIYERKIEELMAVNESFCKSREELFHRRIADQFNTINKQSSEIGRLRRFEAIVKRQNEQKSQWRLKQKEGKKND
jgi:hypothetical protein